MYQDVLIPTDGSHGTRRSIAHGLAIAERFDATVHALSIVPAGPLGTLESEEADRAARRAVARVEADASEAGLDVTSTVERGVPHEEILEYAAANGADLIVMGTQGRTGLDRVLVGSVTERVVRMADVPVVTVRLNDEIRIEDATEAERIARETAAANGYDDVTARDDSHRTSGTWAVTLETATGPLAVDVDAVTGDARVADRED